MSASKNDSKQYTAADIQRYIKGGMSAEEMHAIETAALDDPFLADAIEGFQAAMASDEGSVNAGLSRLNQELGKRIKQPRRTLSISQSRWWQIAAAAMIILITGIAFYNNWIKPEEKTGSLAINEKKTNDSAILQEQEKQSAPPVISDSAQMQDKTVVTPPAAATEIVSAPRSAKGADDLSKQSSNEALAESGKLNELKDEELKEKADRQSSIREAPPITPPVANSEKRTAASAGSTNSEPIARRSTQPSSQLNNFSGRVVDADNKPLPFVDLRILQNKTTVVSDAGGNFSFSAVDSVVEVQVRAVGYGQRNFRLENDNPSNKLVLEPANSLEEVVVTGYGTQRKKQMPDAATERENDASLNKANTRRTVKVQDGVPLVGWIEYEKYLQKNKRPPAGNPLLKGEVVVSFQIKRSNTLSEFKIEKSLSKEHDAEAIRLIAEGPEWKLLKGRKSRITVIVNF